MRETDSLTFLLSIGFIIDDQLMGFNTSLSLHLILAKRDNTSLLKIGWGGTSMYL